MIQMPDEKRFEERVVSGIAVWTTDSSGSWSRRAWRFHRSHSRFFFAAPQCVAKWTHKPKCCLENCKFLRWTLTLVWLGWMVRMEQIDCCDMFQHMNAPEVEHLKPENLKWVFRGFQSFRNLKKSCLQLWWSIFKVKDTPMSSMNSHLGIKTIPCRTFCQCSLSRFVFER